MLLTLPVIGVTVAIKSIVKKRLINFNVIYLIGVIIGALYCCGAGAILFTSGWNGAFPLSATLPCIFAGRYKPKSMGALLIVALITLSIMDYLSGEMNKYFWSMLIMIKLPMLVYGLYYIIYATRHLRRQPAQQDL